MAKNLQSLGREKPKKPENTEPLQSYPKSDDYIIISKKHLYYLLLFII